MPPGAAGPVKPEADADRLRPLIEAEQVRLAVDQVRRLPLPHLLLDACLTWSAVQAGLGTPAWVWLALMTAAQVGRTVYVLRLHRSGRLAAHAMLARMGHLMAGLGAVHALLIVLVFAQSSPSAEYVMTMILVGNAAGAVSPSAGHLRGYLEWAAVFGGTLVAAWLLKGTVEGAAIGSLVAFLFVVLSLYVRDQGRTIGHLVGLSESLRIERDRAEKASEARTRFFAAASHDLRQPLTALSYNAATVQALAQSSGDATLQKVSAAIRRALGESRNLLDSLLEVSELDAGVVKSQPRRIDVARLLDDLDEAFTRVADDKGLSLVVSARSVLLGQAGEVPLQAYADGGLLRRILQNLIGNAIKFTSEGGVTLGAVASADGRHVIFQVSDTGPGIAPEARERVFEEFFQTGNPERNRSRGLGLGLAIVRRLAHLIGAEIRLQSEIGRGSTFEVVVPRADAPDTSRTGAEGRASRPAPLALGAARRVLVVDDESEVAEGLATFLVALGWEARAVPGQEEAVAAWSQGFAPHAIIVDFRLAGGRTGLEVLAALRHLGCHAPAWLVTGETEPSRILAARESGIPILYKPVDGLKLAEMLDAVLTRSEPPRD